MSVSLRMNFGFCPMNLGQKSVKNLVGFLGDLKTPKIHSEINWPLEEGGNLDSDLCQVLMYYLPRNSRTYGKYLNTYLST